MSTTHSTKDFLLNQAQNTTTISEKISCYKKIIELDCDDPGAFHSLGNVYSAFDQGKSKMYWEMSVQKYQKKIESFKDSASKYLKQPDTAKSSEIDPKDVFTAIGQCFYSLGEVYDNLDEYFQASEAYKKSLKMDSTKVYCLFDIAVSLYNDDKLEESKKYLLEFLSWENNYQAHYFLGMIFAHDGSVKEALVEFWSCIDESQDDSLSDWYKARSYNNLGNVKLAEKYLTSAIQKDPEDVDLIYDIISFYEANGEGQKAYEYYEQIRVKKETLRSMRDTM
jgi:tetratricopeptide (TPR) repeat protein